MRFSKNTFTDLAVRMIGFGVIIGVVFPFFAMLLGTPASVALSIWFFVSCILAGTIVGGINILITKVTVGRKLKLVTSKMRDVKNAILKISETGDIGDCTTDKCFITVESNDDFGQASQSFNELVQSFSNSINTLGEIKSYTSLFSSELDLQVLASSALSRIILSSEASAGAIYVEREGEIKLLSSIGLRRADTMNTNANILQAFSIGQRLDILHPEDVIVESTLTEFHPREVLIEPVKFKDIPTAVIVLAKADLFSVDAKKQLSIFAMSLAIALHNAIEHEQLQKIAAIDPLTGVYNRRFGMTRLSEEYARAVRKDFHLGILMVDIDHFKKINDTYGHLAGDRILKSLAGRVRQGMREGDILVRYGGEEFMLILPGASRDDAFNIADRIRHLVKDSQMQYGSYQISMTISIGCVSYPETSADNGQALIAKADEALYRAKNAGRDKVIVQ